MHKGLPCIEDIQENARKRKKAEGGSRKIVGPYRGLSHGFHPRRCACSGARPSAMHPPKTSDKDMQKLPKGSEQCRLNIKDQQRIKKKGKFNIVQQVFG